MRTILFTVGPFEVTSYPVMLCLGALLAIWLTIREIDRKGLDLGTYLTIALIAFSAGLVGARAMNCIVYFDYYRHNPWRMLAIWEGGMAMYGGVILGLVLVYAYVRTKRISFWETLDTLLPPWTLLLVVGRLGCFLNGCCYGKPTTVPWGIHLPETAARTGFHFVNLHPTQLYSAAAALAIFLVMWRVRLKPRFPGQVALIGMILEPIARFTIEFFRADPRSMWRFLDLVTLSESQLLSIPLLLFALSAWRWQSRKGFSTGGTEAPAPAPAARGAGGGSTDEDP